MPLEKSEGGFLSLVDCGVDCDVDAESKLVLLMEINLI